MTEVTVVFPKGGGLNVEDKETCFEDASLFWRVESFNKEIGKVQIAFEDGVDFFDNSHVSPQRTLAYSGSNGNEFAEIRVYGRAPRSPGPKKYTVTGFKANGTKEVEVDPEITVVKDIGPN